MGSGEVSRDAGAREEMEIPLTPILLLLYLLFLNFIYAFLGPVFPSEKWN